MARVIVTAASYDYTELKPLIFSMLDRFVREMIRPGGKVLIKPNFVAAASPEKAMLTHPLIVRAVAEYVIGKGAQVLIGDSPGIGSVDQIVRKGGFAEALAGLNVGWVEFSKSVLRDIGPPFRQIELAADVFEADLVINLPKLKTHGHMLLTIGVKNLFGCVVGLRKPEWHFRAGVDREMFARLLVGIHDAIRPAVTILDAILAMEGQGPGTSGTPRHIGVLMATDDAVALDEAVCNMLGIEPERLLTHRAASERGLVRSYTLEGSLPSVPGFRLPELIPLCFGPRRLHTFLRKHLLQRPIVEASGCRSCGACVTHCPAKAIDQPAGALRFDYAKCIRCYCCIELCPHAALRAAEPLVGTIFRKLFIRH